MITFLLALAALLTGYFFYGKFVEKNFGPDSRETPAVRINDRVDYIPMRRWRIYLIQLLNIAGTGPIFGALSGALFGPIVYLWIVFGCIFAGAVHDYMIGMMSARNDGALASALAGRYLGKRFGRIMDVIMSLLLILIGVVFTVGPADLLALLTPERFSGTFWFWVIVVYYFIATFVPIDKIIGRLYPLFGLCILIMAVGVGGSLCFSGRFDMPELWNAFGNRHASGTAVWPFLFITVACGAISGFHALQSPMMARCIVSEKQGRSVFYGAMITEGVIAMIWAAAGVTCYESSQALLEAGAGTSAVVYEICTSTMGKAGSVLAMLGVVLCPVSSGDTAFRAARLGFADLFRIDQKAWKKRLLMTVLVLGTGVFIAQLDYSVVWRYFSWSNQTIAMICLWTASEYLRREGKKTLVTLIPAVFMSAVTMTYFFAAPECLGGLWTKAGIDYGVYYPLAAAAGFLLAAAFLALYIRRGKKTVSGGVRKGGTGQ